MVHYKIVDTIFILTVLFKGLNHIIATDPADDLKKPNCVISVGLPEKSDDTQPLQLLCNHIGGDGHSFDQVLKQEPLIDLVTKYTPNPKKYPIDQIAKRVGGITINAYGTINIPKGTFANFPNLEELDFNGQISGIVESGNLTIDKDELANLPIHKISIQHLTLSDDAVKALKSTAVKVNKLTISKSQPNRAFLELIDDFSNLTQVDLSDVQDETAADANDTSAFQKSASKLEWVFLNNANVTKVSKNLLHGLVNLRDLYIVSSNVHTIEPGAFDDLKNLENVNLNGNKLKTLPAGLFDKNLKLRIAVLYNNNITNISPANFTNHKDFRELVLQALKIVPL